MADIHLNPVTLTLIIGTFLPLAVGLVVKSSASDKVKTAVMLTATAVSVLIRQAIDNGGVISQASFIMWAFTVVVTVASYYGVWKPVGAGNLAPDIGIGPSKGA